MQWRVYFLAILAKHAAHTPLVQSVLETLDRIGPLDCNPILLIGKKQLYPSVILCLSKAFKMRRMDIHEGVSRLLSDLHFRVSQVVY